MVDDRFQRTALLLGEDGIEHLRKATVMVIGVGAVGGYALEALARSGIGHLILVDFDVFDVTNINRQILALTSTVGRKKVEVAAERVKDINPSCRVDVMDMFVNAETIPQLLSLKPDFVVDAIDTLDCKCRLIEALNTSKMPFISSMGAALKTDPSHIHCGKLSETKNCGLSRQLRQRLKKKGVNLAEIMCVYSDEQVSLPENAVIVNESQNGVRKKSTLGSLPTITAIFGLTIANYVICKISGK